MFGSGDERQEGMYLLRGGTDIVLDNNASTPPVRSFTELIPHELDGSVAVHYVAGAAPRIYVADGADTLRLTSFTNILDVEDEGAANIPSSALVWTRPVSFPGFMPHPTVSNGSNIVHMSMDLMDPRPIPAPMSPTWTLAQMATSYEDGGNTIVVVATADNIYRGVIPTVMGTMFTYMPVRSPGGAQWIGQTAVDLTGDGREEIIGFDLAAHQVCVVDPGTMTLPVMPACIPLANTFAGNEVTIFAGINISMSPGNDFVIVQANANETNYTVIEDVTFNGTTLVSTMAPRAIPVAGPARGRTVIANAGPGTPNVALTFGTDGTVSCALGPC